MKPIIIELTTDEAQWFAQCLDVAAKQAGLRGIALTNSIHNKLIAGLKQASEPPAVTEPANS